MNPQWRKSRHSFSNGNCVEIASWRKSSHSAYNGACVEVGHSTAVVGIRDSQDPDGPRLEVTPAAWAAFTGRLKAR